MDRCITSGPPNAKSEVEDFWIEFDYQFIDMVTSFTGSGKNVEGGSQGEIV